MPDDTGTASHPSIDRLADYDEGLLDTRAATELAGHVADCDACRRSLESIGETRTALAALPPLTVPDDVATRLSSALAEAAGDSAPVPAAATVTVLAQRRSDRWKGRLAASAAGVSILAVLSAIGFFLGHGNGSGSGGRSSGGSSVAAGPAAAPAQGSVSTVVNHTGSRYDTASLRAAIPALLQPTAAEGSTRQGNQPSHTAPTLQPRPVPAALRPLLAPSALDSCLAHLGLRRDQLLAVDYAYYAGKPSLILVVPYEGNPARVTIYVAGPDCASNPAAFGSVIVANR